MSMETGWIQAGVPRGMAKIQSIKEFVRKDVPKSRC